MKKLKTYEAFIERVNELGFMAFSSFLPGFPSLTQETPSENWHTGDSKTDPWQWKDRAAMEKKLAFGCVLGGHKGFISSEMYALFYKALRPEEHMEERQSSGMISPEVWRLWRLFEEGGSLSTGDIRDEMGVTKKKGGSKVERALQELQQHFYITVAGNRRKIDKYGQEYGWAANVYDRTERWAPVNWFHQSKAISTGEARQRILDKARCITESFEIDAFSRMLFKNVE